jgi:predicted phage tail protein
MTSAINYLSINENFPVAGQDNDTQVFRDNFDTIKNNFRSAQEEITDLQTFTVRVDSDNDFNKFKIVNALLQRTAEVYSDNGNFQGAAIDWENGGYQRYVISGSVNVQFQN